MQPISLAKYIQKSPFLYKLLKPVSQAYINLAGYRKFGLRYDDLTLEENEVVQKALNRIPEQESFDRVYRIRRAMQLNINNKVLPKSEWTKPEDDTLYLRPVVQRVTEEKREREAFDSLIVDRTPKPSATSH
ncbi:ubiquinol-cytochrome-c reductase complex subunit 6 [Schizosaccharomyces cryophilus OY26]|uniref:Cytochrome b-c1 complex subunit 7 n=1 Tax=Schizosaccharomyces cryophilus (strain OY26 / ATCC MYA-4695 / CBS 11777 / NBRC 106824 / NRRL Y48691) TaxID=653667 RepID=S9W265_SCHCR|nr:ubiquinol-cytochrome-c reductase complex subunit 6 [Schizosaccharomyces cryophilus OY26]EPY52125.1 ubiquinol-cytochrome-c reductase complex subunit 6 [Schizosaccharomyces cryophilus OY26]